MQAMIWGTGVIKYAIPIEEGICVYSDETQRVLFLLANVTQIVDIQGIATSRLMRVSSNS